MSRLFAAIYDLSMRATEEAGLRAWRRELLAEATGDVLEVGAGTGANLALYSIIARPAGLDARASSPPNALPPKTLSAGPRDRVRSLTLTEPDDAMRARLIRAAAALRGAQAQRALPVEVASASLGALPFTDARFDTVVATLVLCTVADPRAALADVRRVLKPGGRLLFLEHVAADEGTSRFTWQRRVDKVWRHVAGGCRVTRRTEQAIVDAGFTIERMERASMRKAPPWVRPTIRGRAVAPG